MVTDADLATRQGTQPTARRSKLTSDPGREAIWSKGRSEEDLYETSSDRPGAVGDQRRGLGGLCVLLIIVAECHNQTNNPGSGNRYLTGPPTPIDIPHRMRIGRTILAFLVALSLTMLPMAGAFAVPSHEPMESDVVMESADHHCDHESMGSEVVVASSHDCCDHQSIPADHMMKECNTSAGCTAKCFSVVALLFSDVAIPPPTGGTASPFVSNSFHSQAACPPYRPPRV